MNDISRIPAEVKTAMEWYLTQVDSKVPGLMEGFYLVGSIALSDYVPGVSDIDFVAVSQRPPTEAELASLEEIHRLLERQSASPKFDGIYTTWRALSASSSEATVHHWLDKTLHRNSQYAANPVTWTTLMDCPVVRGNARPEVYFSDPELRDWCKANLSTYWANWLKSSRRLGPRFLASFTPEATCWGVLGVVRLHATIRTGSIISKTQAFEYGRRHFPQEWNEILALARSQRHLERAKPGLGTLKRRAKTLEFMEYVIADACGLEQARST